MTEIAPVLEMIKAQLLFQKRPARMGRASFDASIKVDPEHSSMAEVQHRLECNLHLRYRAWLTQMSGQEQQYAKEKATKAFARQLYGPIVDRLIHLEEEMYADGLQDTETFKQINIIIDDLSATFKRET